MKQSNFTQNVSAGEAIKPWLILGPFYEDLSDSVQGLTCFERAGGITGRTTMNEVITEAKDILRAQPREGETADFRHQTARWNLVRRPEKYLSWGNYYIANHLGAVFLSTIVTPNQPGLHRWRLLTRLTSQAVVAINGDIVLNTGVDQQRHSSGMFENQFEADLQPGENVLTIGIFRLARMAQVGCYLALVEGELTTHIPLAEWMAPEIRAQVESEVQGIRLARDLFYPEDNIGFIIDVPPGEETTFRATLTTHDGRSLASATPAAAGMVRLCGGNEIEDGAYSIICQWQDKKEQPITTTTFQIRKATPIPAQPGYGQLTARKQAALELYAETFPPGYGRPHIWTEVARYALGRYADVDEENIRDTCHFIAARKDCADFVIQGILRLMVRDRENPRLSPEIHAMMKDTILGFKYWVDEPGDTVMYMGSENHRFLFHVAEWMAGQLFPTEEFTNSRQRGLYHATKGRMYITEWLRQRGRFGLDEWHSNAYYPICIAPLLNVYDFAIYEDDKLRQMAGAVLDYMFFNLAADSLHGVFGTTHGRSYGRYILHPDFEGTAATCWVLYGTGSLIKGTSGMAPVSIADSRYKLPEILAHIATDNEAVIESKQRQGILRGTARHANFCVYRTPDYLISGLQDHRQGEYEPSTHVAQVTLANKIVIFWSCPHTSGEGSGLRPDYWSGHTTLPRVIQYRNVMSLTWRLSEFAWMSHCFFEQERMDEVRFAGNWAFARVKQGYVGIYSQSGFKIGSFGQYTGRELICQAAENTWLVECGRQADWGSFEAFVRALQSAPIEVNGDEITYTSPSIGQFITGWNVIPTVAGEPIQLRRYPLVDSPWAHADFGSGELTVQFGDKIYELWFNQ